jgi:3-hydroxyisobutyrate dehydrogenase-like beta-hydroxyacid dehydrogenase
MAATRVALLAPGEMGAAVGARLIARGASVTTCLAGRGPRSAALAAKAGLALAPDLAVAAGGGPCNSLHRAAGGRAVAGRDMAAAARQAGAAPLFVDCDAVAPDTVRAVAAVVARAGMECVDADIVGAPPHPTEGGGRRFYQPVVELAMA